MDKWFDEKLERTQDYDFYFQLIGKGAKFSGVARIFYNYRIHPEQGIRDRSPMIKSRKYIIKKLCSGVYFKS